MSGQRWRFAGSGGEAAGTDLSELALPSTSSAARARIAVR